MTSLRSYPAVLDIGRNGEVLAAMGERLLVERLEEHFHLLLEVFPVGVVVYDRSAERLDLTAVVAATNAEYDAPIGKNVRHCVVFSESKRDATSGRC